MNTLNLGKPFEPAAKQPLGRFPGAERALPLPRRRGSLRATTVAVFFVSSAAVMLGIFGAGYLWRLEGPFAHPAKDAYTGPSNIVVTIIPLHSADTTAGYPPSNAPPPNSRPPNPRPHDSQPPDSPPANSQYVQSGQPVMLRADHN